MSDDPFLRAILNEPGNDAPRLVYADWLEEQGDPVSAAKAEFLRLSVQIAARTESKGRRRTQKKRLQQLAAELDTSWLAVVSQLAIENCLGKSSEAQARSSRLLRFDFLCDRRWENLQPTGDRAVRFCDACKQNVHYCETITEARRHAWDGHCIAVDIGVIRRGGDLQPQMMVLGRPSVESLRREQERMEPDPVSAERERRKRKEATSEKT
jgi:uncharacterized protein (TIGR02996 family)